MTVRWNKRALTQLRAAHGWIKKDNPIAAEEFVDEPGVAMFPLVRYRHLIYYKVLDSEEVRIIRVHHGSRKRPT